ncbi:MAG: DUF805 domain-containing protein [Victivallaceae bacterium]
MNWYIEAFKHYFDFDGRASRKAYWMFFLFNMIFALVAYVLDLVLGTSLFYPLYSLAVLIPSLAIMVRRFHDIDRSAWNLLWLFLPLIGGIVILVMMLLRGTAGANNYGEDPYAMPGEGNEPPSCGCGCA